MGSLLLAGTSTKSAHTQYSTSDHEYNSDHNTCTTDPSSTLTVTPMATEVRVRHA